MSFQNFTLVMRHGISLFFDIFFSMNNLPAVLFLFLLFHNGIKELEYSYSLNITVDVQWRYLDVSKPQTKVCLKYPLGFALY